MSTNNINKINGILVSLNVSVWGARKKEKQVENQACNLFNVQTGNVSASKMLIDKAYLLPLKRIEQEARQYFYQNSVAWLDGVRLVPLFEFQRVSQHLDDLRNKFNHQVDIFKQQYKNAITQAQTALGSLFDCRQYPYDVSTKFHFGMQVMPVNQMTDESDIRLQLSDDITNRINDTVRTNRENAFTELLEQGCKLLENVAETLSQGDKIFRNSLINNLLEYAKHIESMNGALNDSRLTTLAELLRKQAEFNPDELRENHSKRSDCVYSANSILQAVESWM